ncbi:MAG: asparagine synthase (glutamine-hydrolyzing) [Candidatus Aminicenantes bacterium]|nr:asparagine synthase (glutamine-hydrolyzing) [Candidatus Aminicenantes bacterium]
MCGICGIASSQTGIPVPPSLLASMCKTIYHRGPDDEGQYIDTGVALGVRRLSIIDVAGGHQPLANEDGSVWVAHNGEIYNFPELRKELMNRGHTFKTQTDTETVVHCYEEWGEDFVGKLRGMYAFALWDSKLRKLYIVRDRVGIKPLYYSLLEDGSLVFGSELKALLIHPGVKRSLEPRALDLFLTLEYIPQPLSIFSGIFKLPAGSYLVYERGRVQIRKYWEIEPGKAVSRSDSPSSLSELKDNLYELIKESVRVRLLSDVPLGAFLSGGIDSSAIVGMMHELGASPIKTFSIGFEDKTYDELRHARRIAQRFGTDHEEFVISPQALEMTEKLIHHLDEPFGDFSVFPTFLVSEMAEKHVKVILSGDGGDELFAGYEHYQAQAMARFPCMPLLQKPVSAFMKKLPPSAKKKGVWNKAKRYAQGFEHNPDLRHFRWMMFLSNAVKHRLYSHEFIHDLAGVKDIHLIPPLETIFNTLRDFDAITGELYLDLKTYLVDDILVKVDRMSMAASLETRVPLLDHKIVEFAFQLPGMLKLRGMKTKWIFKKTMERLLPKETIYRKKEGFSIPIKHWLRDELKDLMLYYLGQKRIQDEGLFNYEVIKEMVERHLRGRENYSHQLWALLVFEIWREHYL